MAIVLWVSIIHDMWHSTSCHNNAALCYKDNRVWELLYAYITSATTLFFSWKWFWLLFIYYENVLCTKAWRIIKCCQPLLFAHILLVLNGKQNCLIWHCPYNVFKKIIYYLGMGKYEHPCRTWVARISCKVQSHNRLEVCSLILTVFLDCEFKAITYSHT